MHVFYLCNIAKGPWFAWSGTLHVIQFQEVDFRKVITVISGGMPILAGRAFGIGSIDTVGIFFMFGILFWIPTHILTFSIKYADD